MLHTRSPHMIWIWVCLAMIPLPGSAVPDCVSRNESITQCGGVTCVNGECVTQTQTCSCDDYWTGVSCDVCCALDCTHGHCIDVHGVGECLCDKGWAGSTCSVPDNTISAPAAQGFQGFPPVPIAPTNCSLPHRNMTEYCVDRTCYHGFCERTIHPTEGHNFTLGECICDEGWHGVECDQCCDLVCDECCTCDLHDNDPDLPFCICNYSDEASNCTSPFTMPPIFMFTPTTVPHQENLLWAIGVTLAVVVLVVASGVLFMVVLYKKRYYWIMRIAFPFRPYENNDGRKYDAFISYRSSNDEDRHFVVYQMFPKLEKEMGFKLCIDHRDFIPGAAIANNVIEAIAASRATILLLSPAFCDSGWTQFEYQRAQLASIVEHHRIIPIMFKDVSQVEDMDVNLDHIIKTITYLEWPGSEASKKDKQKFWEKLVMSMPKLKPTQESSENPSQQTVVHL